MEGPKVQGEIYFVLEGTRMVKENTKTLSRLMTL